MSNINRAEQRLQNRVANDLTQLKRNENARGTRQLFGADNIPFETSNQTYATFTLASGSINISSVTLQSNNSSPHLFPIFMPDLRLNVDDAAHSYPEGSSLTGGDIGNTRFNHHLDLLSSDPDIGKWVVRIIVINSTGSPVTYFLRTAWRFPKVTI